MSKRFKLADSQPSTSSSYEINWDLCFLCQEKGGDIQCPSASTIKEINSGTGYYTLAQNIAKFYRLGQLPIPLKLPGLDDVDGLANTLNERSA